MNINRIPGAVWPVLYGAVYLGLQTFVSAQWPDTPPAYLLGLMARWACCKGRSRYFGLRPPSHCKTGRHCLLAWPPLRVALVGKNQNPHHAQAQSSGFFSDGHYVDAMNFVDIMKCARQEKGSPVTASLCVMGWGWAMQVPSLPHRTG